MVSLVAVNVGMPSLLGVHRGREVISGMVKRPVGGSDLWLARLNLEGDGQADLTVHGGPDKAVYAYPTEHLPAWSSELGQDLGPADFGENLSTAGCDEDDVCIGDRWRWGDALLEVCQPRWPCFKLAMYRRRGDIGEIMKTSGRTGWYLRVLEEGRVPVGGPIDVELRHPMAATVRLCHQAARTPPAKSAGVPEEVLEALLGVEPLAAGWQAKITARLAATGRPGGNSAVETE